MRGRKESGVLESLRFAFRRTLAYDKGIFACALLPVPFRVLNRLADVYLIALIVDAVTREAEGRLIAVILALALCKLAAGLVMRFADWQLSARNYRSKMKFLSRFAAGYMQSEFTAIESIAGKDLAQRARNAMTGIDYRDKSPVERVFVQCAELAGDFCGLSVYAGIIAVLNPLILLLLLITSGVSYLLQRALVDYDQKDKRRYIPLERRLWYLIKELRELSAAKDICLYHLMDWLRELFGSTLAERMKLHNRRSRYQYAFLVVINLLNTGFTGFIYYYLIQQYRSAGIDISQFLLYFGLITGFSAWLMSIADGLEGLRSTLLGIEDIRRFHQLPSRTAVPPSPAPAEPEAAIRLEDVTFGYQPEQPVISHMNLTIAPGEKVALVGLNGAGKTTLVKLLCGLYAPQSGRILLHGRDLRSFGAEELAERFAVVFQDIHLLPATIERNITLSDRADPLRLREVLALSGLEERIASLPGREQTLLVKSVLEDAIDLSGGEEQKLALARALYKGGDIFILDEPTAKLDPIAENELYQKYSALTEGKASLFISHRLSSTRFCDRILYLEQGTVRESGTHEQLLQLGGAYARLFETQSRYYKSGGMAM